MASFQHIEPALRLIGGSGALEALADEVGRAGCSRAVIFCGSSLEREGSGLQRVRDALGDRCAGVFTGVRQHSPVASVEAAARALRELRADAVIAVGGGSAIVTARAAAILVAEGKPFYELCTRRQADGSYSSPKLRAPKMAQFVVLTTPTTAAAKAGSAVFDEASGERLAMFDPKTRAQAVFIDPELSLSSPADLALTASLNTFSMAVEGLESASGDAMSDGMLMQALRLLRDGLPRLCEEPQNADLRNDLMMAAILCGRGTDFAGGGLASVLGHALGARFEIANGLANAIMLPHTMRFNAQETSVRMGKIAEALGAESSSTPDAIGRVDMLLDRIAIPRRLRDAGIARELLHEVSAAAMNDWFLSRNPRRVQSAAELTQLLHAAW